MLRGLQEIKHGRLMASRMVYNDSRLVSGQSCSSRTVSVLMEMKGHMLNEFKIKMSNTPHFSVFHQSLEQ